MKKISTFMKKHTKLFSWIAAFIIGAIIVEIFTGGGVSQSVSYWISVITGNVNTSNPENKENENNFEKATVSYVVDGDTIVVNTIANTYNGEKKVRMIGVNTPESVHSDSTKNTKEGTEASDYTKSQLTKGMTVYLEYDKDLEDDYGRTLAYVWLTDDCDTENYEDFCKYNYGAILLQNTHCEAVYYEPNGMYRTWYEKLDAEN